MELGWELPEPGPRLEVELAAFQLPSSMPLKRRSILPGGGGSLQGGRFEIAVVEKRQPKITMGCLGGWDPGEQPLTWLAALVSLVHRPVTANEKPTRSVLRKAGILRLVPSLCRAESSGA